MSPLPEERLMRSLTRNGWPTDMIDSSRTTVSEVTASPVSLEAGCVSTLHTLMSSGALAATTKDPMASIAKGTCNTLDPHEPHTAAATPSNVDSLSTALTLLEALMRKLRACVSIDGSSQRILPMVPHLRQLKPGEERDVVQVVSGVQQELSAARGCGRCLAHACQDHARQPHQMLQHMQRMRSGGDSHMSVCLADQSEQHFEKYWAFIYGCVHHNTRDCIKSQENIAQAHGWQVTLTCTDISLS